MFERVRDVLKAAIGELVVPVDAAALTDSLALLDQLTARVVDGIGAFDRAEAWSDSGAVSMTAWLRSTGCSARNAHAMARTARRLGDLPVLAEAYRNGTLSSGQVQAIVVNLNDAVTPLFAWAEADLVPTLAAMPVVDVAAAMQTWAQAAKDSLVDPADPEPARPERRLHLSRTMDGRRELSGSLDAEAGAIAETALRLASTDDVDGEPGRTPAERRADALVDILRFFLDHQQTHRGGRHRPHLNVFLDHDDLGDAPGSSGWLPDGTLLDGATLRRLACDAGVHRVITQGRSSILDYGTTTRTIPANLFNALVARDRHCRFGDCDRPAEWCDAHHVTHWADGGPTELGNLVLGCSRHHHLVHQPGWHAKLLPDGTYLVSTPNGHTIESRPSGRPPDLFGSQRRAA
ncbi:MAG TPA: DUF222 domain-containing protein [Acidimicrobiales bacterium]|nr:DUF222 domain-containing protein [Acidimicrobiales bacterium]